MIVENKDEITFEEFSAWMVGMIRGKGGAIPDLDDWKEIKKMMDKVAPTKEYITAPSTPLFPDIYPPPFTPPFQPWNTGTPPFWSPGITCDNQTSNEIKLDVNGTTTTTAKEGDEPLYIYPNDGHGPAVTNVSSGFVQPDASKSAYGMAEAILSMESLSNQIRVGD